MATVYKIDIEITSAFVNYNEKQIEKLFHDFIINYKDKNTKLGFENPEICVAKIA